MDLLCGRRGERAGMGGEDWEVVRMGEVKGLATRRERGAEMIVFRLLLVMLLPG